MVEFSAPIMKKPAFSCFLHANLLQIILQFTQSGQLCFFSFYPDPDCLNYLELL